MSMDPRDPRYSDTPNVDTHPLEGRRPRGPGEPAGAAVNAIRHSFYESPRGYGWRARLAWFVLHAGCRHPVGIVCSHRQYEYDHYLSGNHDGWRSGTEREQRHQREEQAR